VLTLATMSLAHASAFADARLTLGYASRPTLRSVRQLTLHAMSSEYHLAYSLEWTRKSAQAKPAFLDRCPAGLLSDLRVRTTGDHNAAGTVGALEFSDLLHVAITAIPGAQQPLFRDAT
jgi:hypothetical protein